MDWRDLESNDMTTCLRIHPELFGREVVSNRQAQEIWKELLAAQGFKGVVILKNSSKAAPSIAGFGASVFVEDSFADQELKNPQPGLNGRVVSHVLASDSITFSRSKIGVANSRDGLNVVVLAGRWDPSLVDQQEIQEVCVHLATTFAGLHSGYRFKRVIIELISKQDRMFADAVPMMRVHSELGMSRALAIVEKPDVQANQGSILAPHFSYLTPQLLLRASDQELLLFALGGGTDQELSQRLHLTLGGVRRRWAALFERIEQIKPDLLRPAQNGKRQVRGPQKRHLVLAYVRKHPEELRPFVQAAKANAPSSNDE